MSKKPDKLAQEVNMALAAGMSYGKQKAMQTPVVIEKPKPKPIAWKVCEICGNEFPVFDNKTRKYCGDKCRNVVAARMKKRWLENRGQSKNDRSE